MKHVSRTLLALLVALPWTVSQGAAQVDDVDAETLCSQQPAHPACRAIFLQYCAQNPNEPACLSDDEDDSAQ